MENAKTVLLQFSLEPNKGLKKFACMKIIYGVLHDKVNTLVFHGLKDVLFSPPQIVGSNAKPRGYDTLKSHSS